MSEAPASDLAIFDLCDTLYAENTTHGFIEFFISKQTNNKENSLYRLVYARHLPVFYLFAALHRFWGLDLYRWALARALKGYSRGELNAAAEAYVARRLAQIENTEIHERLAKHKAAGDRVIIVSNSLDVVVEAVAARLGIAGRGSRLGFVGDRCTGRIEIDLTGRKAGITRSLAAEPPAPRHVHAYTDNLSDRDLLQAVDRPTIIIPAGRTRAPWGGLGEEINAVFIEL